MKSQRVSSLDRHYSEGMSQGLLGKQEVTTLQTSIMHTVEDHTRAGQMALQGSA